MCRLPGSGNEYSGVDANATFVADDQQDSWSKGMKLRLPATIVLILFAASPTLGTAADVYPKNLDIDVLHYVFELTLSDATDRINGVTTVQIRFLTDGVENFELDLIGSNNDPVTGMSVSAVDEMLRDPGRRMSLTMKGSVPPGGTALEFTHDVDRLRIVLPEPALRGQVRRFRIQYRGTPERGLIIGENMHGDRTFFSDNWPNWARNWLPTIDHPYEKATSEMVVTAPDHYQVISNGLLVEETNLGGGALSTAQSVAGMSDENFRRSHWKQSVPIASWLFVLGVARFAVDYYDEFDNKSLQTWVYAQDRENGFYDFAVPTKQVMQFYSDVIGPYAYEKLANVQSNSVGGGMEAATAIFYGDNSVTGERTERWRNVIIHEIAHQWWGNAVTEADWDDVWLSEGFATYFTLLYREYAYGRDDFLEGLAADKQRIISFYAERPDYTIVHNNLDPIGRDTVTTGMMYQKGSWFLHMLRGMIGEDRFWSGIREYYRLYYNRNATTDDFREVMENTYEPAINLSGFFRQWLNQGGFPNLRGDWDWDPTTNELVITLEQVDDDGYVFEMAIPVAITVPADPAVRTGRQGGRGADPQTLAREIILSPGMSETRIELDREPTAVVFDPDHWVLMEMEFNRR